MYLDFYFIYCPVLLLICLKVNGEQENSGLKSSYSQQDGIFRELESFEVVSPAVLNSQGRWRREAVTKTEFGHREKIALKLQRPTKHTMVMDLTLNRGLLVAGFVSKHYDSRGRLVRTSPQVHDHCFYQGTLRGNDNSVVSISTCKGIEGLIHDGNETYYVQPVNKEGVMQHILFNMNDLKQKEIKCGQGHSIDPRNIGSVMHNSPFVKHKVRRSTDKEVRYVELVLVNDHEQFLHYKTLKDTEYRGKHIMNLVDSLYRPLNIRVALLMMITWTDRNRITVDSDSDKTLSNFIKYRQEEIVKILAKENIKSHDNAQLLSHNKFKGSTVGKAQVMAMCASNSAAVVRDHSANAGATAATFAHELGHNFGLHHDEDYKRDDCKCDKETGCIMSGVARYKPATKWSPCSREVMKKMFARGLDTCLLNTPRRLHGDPVCGNGFKEEGEECDCGTAEECKQHTHDCCNATTCKLYSHTECSEGACCDRCKFKSSGSVCRKRINYCDIPEFCNGKSELCPENVYAQDGTPCDHGYCFNGRCPTRKQQCEYLWGKGARDADDANSVCYTSNVKGLNYANCGVNSSTKNFIKCKKEDMKCGKLWCKKDSKDNLPIIGVGGRGYKQFYPSLKVNCWSATLDMGLDDVPDPTVATDGVKCGEDMICHNAKCIHIHHHSWKIVHKLCPRNCSGHGVCTTKSECYCDTCWGGNDCSKSIRCPWESDDRTTVAGIVIAVFIILILIVGLVFAIRNRKQLYQKWQNYKKNKSRYNHISMGTPQTSRNKGAQKSSTAVQNNHVTKPSGARLEISGPVTTDSSSPVAFATPSVTTVPKPAAASKPAASGAVNLPSWPPVSTHEKPVYKAKSWQDKEKEQPAKAMWKPPVKKDDGVSSRPSSAVTPPKKPQWPPPGKKEDTTPSKKPSRPPAVHRASSPPGTLDANQAIRPQGKPRPDSLAGVLNQEKAAVPGKPGSNTQLSKKPSFGRPRPPPLTRKPSGAQELDSGSHATAKQPGIPVSRKPSGAQNVTKPHRQTTAPPKRPLPLERKPSGAEELDGVKKGLRPTGVLPGSGARPTPPGGKMPLLPPGKNLSSQH